MLFFLGNSVHLIVALQYLHHQILDLVHQARHLHQVHHHRHQAVVIVVQNESQHLVQKVKEMISVTIKKKIEKKPVVDPKM